MHNRSDQFAKNILRDALSRAATAETEVEVTAAAQKIDVYCVPDPARAAERAEMGLLGELSAEPSLFEPFHDTPGLAQVRRCLRRQLTWHHELERRARAGASEPEETDEDAEPRRAVPFPALVIIGPGRPETVLDALRCERVRDGVYSPPPGLAMRVVVLAELPRTRDTLLLRLLGARRVLREAIEDLAALPPEAWERSIATPLLVHFRLEPIQAMAKEDSVTSAEIRAWHQEYEKNLKAEAAAEAERKVLLRQLRARFGDLPQAIRARVEAAGLPDLEQWFDRVLDARTLAEVLGEPA